jgi:hypothetical protein
MSSGNVKQPKVIPVPKGNGYPNNVANTQTLKTRGGKAQTKGNKSSTRMA